MKLSAHFERMEFACHCGCGLDTVDCQLLEVLEIIRQNFDAAVSINSACRCPDHNASVGGSERSQHLYGRAADIVVSGVHPDEVADYLDKTFPDSLGLGRYNSFTHVDTRVGKARWDG